MRFTVSRIVVLLGVATWMTQAPAVRADNVCQCATPPGGMVTCPDDFFPMCTVKEGKANGSCTPIPKDLLKNEKALHAWVLTKVIGRKIEPQDVKKDEHQLILKNQRYENKMTGEIITFKLPKVQQ